jgi:hypothetical protein
MGYVRPFYPKIAIFDVLDYMRNLVFNLLLGPINRTLEDWSSLQLILT